MWTLGRTSKHRRRTRQRRKPHHLPELAVERLEDRTLLSFLLDLDANDSAAPGVDYRTMFLKTPVRVADTDAIITDPDSLTLASLTVTLTNRPDGAAESLSANTAGTSISAAYNSSNGVLSLSGQDTVGHYQQVLRTVTYDNTNRLCSNPADRIIRFLADDGATSSNVARTTVDIDNLVFVGKIPPVAGSQAKLFLPADVRVDRTFCWKSSDSVLNEINVTDPMISRWNVIAGTPTRLVFVASGGGARFNGNVLLDPYNRAVVDVVKTVGGVTKRARYLVELADLYTADREPCIGCNSCVAGACGADEANLFNGGVDYTKQVHSIPGRGMDWSFDLTYRSDVHLPGPVGFNWDFNYNRRLVPVTADNLCEIQQSFPDALAGDAVQVDGTNRADIYATSGGSFTLCPYRIFASFSCLSGRVMDLLENLSKPWVTRAR